MKVIEHISKSREIQVSYEIVPPPRGSSAKDIIDVVEELQELNPPWIDVTSHSSVTHYHEQDDGTIRRRTVRKRPGTLGICGIIQNRFRIDTVAHILCHGFTREETEDALIELSFLGIHNILALRGDTHGVEKAIPRERTKNQFASDLVAQISAMKKGHFLEDIDNSEALEFGVGVAGYPEKHFEAPSLRTDILHLKKKVDAGAEYIMTQMFFDNEKFFSFEKACREAGITVPIVPGLKILRSVSQLNSLPRSFYIDLPDELVDEVTRSPQHVGEIGIRWAKKQAEELLSRGVRNLHFYVLNDVHAVVDVVKKLR